MANKKIQITESDVNWMTMECVKLICENEFSNQLDRNRAGYYIRGKKRGLEGDALKAFVDEKMKEDEAKQAALRDFSKELRKEHPNHLEDDEFYGHSREMADSEEGFPYTDF